jgi:uncharacterized protein (DUF488 family)
MPSSACSKTLVSSWSSTSARRRSRARRASPYRHLRGLGTPKSGREAARAGCIESFDRIFLAHMDEPEALLDLGEAIALAKAQPVCLLCLERDPEHCHRLIVGNRMVAETRQRLRHLFVEADAARAD